MSIAVYPTRVSKNLVGPSAFVSYSRFWAFAFGFLYAKWKGGYLESYIHSEDMKKVAQLKEAKIDLHTLRGITFHNNQVWDPQYTELQMKFRDCYPNFYLHPNDEFVYQVTRGRKKERQIKDDLHAEAVQFLKDWQKSEGKQ